MNHKVLTLVYQAYMKGPADLISLFWLPDLSGPTNLPGVIRAEASVKPSTGSLDI